MVIDAATPYKGIMVSIGFYLGSVNEQFFERDQSFLFQSAQELVVQIIQYLRRQFFALEIVKSIPQGFLTFGEPDKSQISIT